MIEVDAYCVRVALPYSFPENHLRFKPNLSIPSGVETPAKFKLPVKNDAGLMLFDCIFEEHKMNQLQTKYGNAFKKNILNDCKQKLSSFIEMVNSLKNDLEEYNHKLKDEIKIYAKKEFERHKKQKQILAELGGHTENMVQPPSIIPEPVILKIPTSQKGKKIDYISVKKYNEAINKHINEHLKALQPQTQHWKQFNEDSFRDTILVFLKTINTNASSEAKNGKGKTDISIIQDGQIIYIAELKMWKGAVAIVDALKQLVSYTDLTITTANLFIFNKATKNIGQVNSSLGQLLENKYTIIEKQDTQYKIKVKCDNGKEIIINIYLHHFIEMQVS